MSKPTALVVVVTLGLAAVGCGTLDNPPVTRVRNTAVVVREQTRADGKKRTVVVAQLKGTVLATAT